MDVGVVPERQHALAECEIRHADRADPRLVVDRVEQRPERQSRGPQTRGCTLGCLVADRRRFFVGIAASRYPSGCVLRQPDDVAGRVAHLPAGATHRRVPFLLRQPFDQCGEGFVFGQASIGYVRTGLHRGGHRSSVRVAVTLVDSLRGNGPDAAASVRCSRCSSRRLPRRAPLPANCCASGGRGAA